MSHRAYRWRVSILAALSLLALLALLRRFDQPQAQPPPASPPPAPAPASSLAAPLAAGSQAPSLQSSPDAEAETREESAIENERVIAFASGEGLEAFLTAAAANGLNILGTNRSLLAARLGLDTPAEQRTAEALAGEEAEWELNHTVLIPFPVGSMPGDPGTPFEDRALPFLGVPRDNASWGTGVTVAILDTGVLPHPSLEGVRIDHLDLTSQPGDPFAPHGTAVASLVAGQIGVAPSAALLSIRVLDGEGIGDSFTLAQGITEAVDRGADLINLSLGTFGDSPLLRQAVDYAAKRGVVLVAASGNEGLPVVPYPGEYEEVLAVAAVDADGRHAPFANQGRAVDVAAPGVGLYTAWAESQWASFSGTSASAPLVAGSLAALMSQPNSLDARAAAERLLSQANDMGYPGRDSQTGAGVIDLQRAMRQASEPLLDLALADIYFDPRPSSSGERVVHITAQNRGTERIPSASLELSIDGGSARSLPLGPLEPGEIGSHQIRIFPPQPGTGRSLVIDARAIAGAASEDALPANNRRRAQLRAADVGASSP